MKTPVLLLAVAIALGSSTLAAEPAGSPEERFWNVLDASRGPGGCEAAALRLEVRLQKLDSAALEEFAHEWARWWDVSYSWDLWGAAYLIQGGCSDDGFDYFRGWLLTEGSSRWNRIRKDLESAFDDVEPGTETECEDITVVLPNVYEERFGKEAPDSGYHEPSGKPWTEETLASRFPKLARRFGSTPRD